MKKDFETVAPQLPDCFIIYPFGKVVEQKRKNFRSNEYIGVSKEEIGKLRFSEYINLKDKLVILQTVSFRNKKTLMHIAYSGRSTIICC